MNPNTQSATEKILPHPKRFTIFGNKVKRIDNMSLQQLEEQFSNPETKQLFEFSLDDLFPEQDTNPTNIFKQAQFKNFSSNQKHLDNFVIDFIINSSKYLRISSQSIFYYMDQLISISPQLYDSFNNQKYLQNNSLVIYEKMMNLHYGYKLKYIESLYGFFHISNELEGERKIFLDQFISQINIKNNFMKILYQNIQIKDQTNISQYHQQNINIFIFNQLQFIVIFQQIIIQMYDFGYVSLENWNDIAKSFLKMFYDQNYKGSLLAIHQKSKLVDPNQSSQIFQLNLTTELNQIIISKAIFFCNIHIDNIYDLNSVNQTLSQLNNIVSEIFNEEIVKSNKNMTFIITTLKVVNQVLASKFQNSQQLSDLIQFLSDKFRDVGGEEYDTTILQMIENYKKSYNISKCIYRILFRKLFEFIWSLNIYNFPSFQDIIKEELQSEVLFELFKEIMKENLFLVELYKEDNENNQILKDFVQYHLDSFPYSDYQNQQFCQIIQLSLGNSCFDFSELILVKIQNLEKVCFELKYDPDFRVAQNLTPGLRNLEKKQLNIAIGIDMESNNEYEKFEIRENTIFYERPNSRQVYIFEQTFDFPQHLLNTLLNFIYQQENDLSIYLLEYIKVLCKFIQKNPSLLSKFCQDQNESILKIFSILFQYLQLFTHEFSYLEYVHEIIKTIKSVVQSDLSSEILTFMKLFFLQNNQSLIQNPFIMIVHNYEENSKNQLYSYNGLKNYYYKILKNTFIILQFLFQDDQIWLNNVNNAGNYQSIEQSLYQLKYFLENPLQKNCFEELREALNILKIGFFEINQYELISFIWKDFVIYLINNFIINDSLTLNDLPEKKYLVYREMIELLKVFYSKFYPNNSQYELLLNSQPFEGHKNYYLNLQEFSQQIKLVELFCFIFEVKINTQEEETANLLQQGMFIENKHIVINIKKTMNEFGKKAVLQFLESSIELLGMILEICYLKLQQNQDQDYLLKEILQNFCYKETIIRYQFNDFSINRQINILLALISLMKYEGKQQSQVQHLKNYQLEIDQNLFIDQQVGQNFLQLINPNILCDTNLHDNNWKKQISLNDSIFKTLSNFIKLWNYQQTTFLPEISEFLYGYLSEINNNLVIKNYFFYYLLEQISLDQQGVIEFLLQCFDSQFSIWQGLFEFGENLQQNQFLEYIKYRLNAYKTLTEIVENTQEEYYYLNLILLSIKMLRSKKFSYKQQELIQKELLTIVQEIFFEIIRQKKVKIQEIVKFLYINLYEKSENLTKIDNLNYFKTLYNYETQNLCQYIFEEFLNLIKDQFLLKLSGRENFFFKKENSQFFSLLSEYYQDIYQYILSNVYLNSMNLYTELQKILFNQIFKLSSDIYQHFPRFSVEQLNNINLVRTNEEVKTLLNPLEYYLNLKHYGIEEDQSKIIFNFSRFYNIYENFINSYQQSFICLSKILELACSFGFDGQISGCDFTLTSTDSNHYLFAIKSFYEKYKLQQEINPKDIFIINQIKLMLNTSKSNKEDYFSYKTKISSKFQFSEQEQDFLHLYSLDKELNQMNLMVFYSKIFNQKLNKDNAESIQNSLYARISEISNSFQQFSEQNEYKHLNIISVCNIAKLFNLHLKNLIHLTPRVFSLSESIITVPFNDVITEYLECISYFLKLQASKDMHRDQKYFPIYESILNSTSFLTITGVTLTSPIFKVIWEVIEEIIFRGKLSQNKIHAKKLSQTLLTILQNIFCINPFVLNENFLNNIGEYIQRPNLDDDQLCKVFDLLYVLASSDQTTNEFIQSNIFQKLLNIPIILNDKDYDSSQFYSHEEVKPIHSKFLKLLQIQSILILQFYDYSFLFDKVRRFIDCYYRRIEMLLSLHEDPNFVANNTQGCEIQSNFKSLATLRELTEVLKILSFLSDNIQNWRNIQQKNCEKYFYFLFRRILKLFTHEIYKPDRELIQKGNKNISDKILPKNAFEIFLQEIVLVDDKKSLLNLMPTDNIKRDGVNSTRRNHLSFQSYQHSYYQNQGIITTLFSFIVDQLCCEIAQYSGYCLQNLLPVFQLAPLKQKSSLNDFDSSEKLIQCSNDLIDTLVFLMFVIKKTTHHQQLYNEGTIKLRLYFQTDFAYKNLNGANINFEQLSVVELKQQVRKTFEIFIHLAITFQLQCLELKQDNTINLKNEVMRHKDWLHTILKEYEQWLPIKKGPLSSINSPHTTPFKTVSKLQALNQFEEQLDFQIQEDLYLLSEKSLANHVKNFEMLKKKSE